ncbi:GNAT family N-acetyltransferase [Thalassorhabdomicrobium marinisediminis]|uniref:GNAT family N-acetyltransferase n=1 Tax=Thalassorhabdomicrobium marinisediminis TaxID=2170577 RepID=A0A2T7FYG4_9RHOB|nr:N-acetyltransferase [Thalassorhabdomicrobium marinisediminis]PVA07178.1 GNAT family N-acetyltransferase [Thalassorhabdomicrobium marinisediminis]
MTPDGLARTHGAAFGAAGWRAESFRGYLDDPRATLWGDETCFAVLRRAGPEAEVLTLATHPAHQGQGRATAMLRAALAGLAAQGVEEVFLEVAQSNTAALALYRACGFETFGQRVGYYRNGDTAVCMKAQLSATSGG